MEKKTMIIVAVSVAAGYVFARQIERVPVVNKLPQL
jgi:hypothetical protein